MEILYQEPIMEMARNYCIAAGVIGVISVISFIVFVFSDSWSIGTPIGCICTIISLVALIVVMIKAPMIDTGRNKYEVILDDSVSANEIYEKYKIIEQRGEIWVIEDKESEE